jgi:hypothetical protein
MFLPHLHFQWKNNERLLGSDLNKFGKDTNKKVLSKIDLSSPIDKPDQQDSTMFFVREP